MTNRLIHGMIAETTRTDAGRHYQVTGSPVLDFFVDAPNARTNGSMNQADVANRFRTAYEADNVMALAALLWLRDPSDRGGAGERLAFHTSFDVLTDIEPRVAARLVEYIPEYGYWKDLIRILDRYLASADDGRRGQVVSAIGKVITKQFRIDLGAERPSLLAKWLPREGGAHANAALWLTRRLGLSPKLYRKTVADLTRKLNVVEQQMSANQWDEIEYRKVASKAHLNYKGAFMRHSPERYAAYLSAVERGDADIKSKALFPYELVAKYVARNLWGGPIISQVDRTVEAQWNALPNYVPDGKGALTVLDTSGSMFAGYTTGTTPVMYAMALAVYSAERQAGVWANQVVTFGRHPRMVDLTGADSLRRKLELVDKACDELNTDLQAVFELILDVAQANNLTDADLPGRVIVLSDMAFNSGSIGGASTDFRAIKRKFEAAGYAMPTLVFWKIGHGDQKPVPAWEGQAMLVSGASPALFRSILSDDLREITPEELMNEVLATERYRGVAEQIVRG